MRRRASFTDNLMKYEDWMELANPLRDRKGFSYKEIQIIKKIKAVRRYPVPETLLHAPPDYDLFIDSIITVGYQSDEIFKDADKEPELVVPY